MFDCVITLESTRESPRSSVSLARCVLIVSGSSPPHWRAEPGTVNITRISIKASKGFDGRIFVIPRSASREEGLDLCQPNEHTPMLSSTHISPFLIRQRVPNRSDTLGLSYIELTASHAMLDFTSGILRKRSQESFRNERGCVIPFGPRQESWPEFSGRFNQQKPIVWHF
jgi:hypothetical protein